MLATVAIIVVEGIKDLLSRDRLDPTRSTARRAWLMKLTKSKCRGLLLSVERSTAYSSTVRYQYSIQHQNNFVTQKRLKLL